MNPFEVYETRENILAFYFTLEEFLRACKTYNLDDLESFFSNRYLSNELKQEYMTEGIMMALRNLDVDLLGYLIQHGGHIPRIVFDDEKNALSIVDEKAEAEARLAINDEDEIDYEDEDDEDYDSDSESEDDFFARDVPKDIMEYAMYHNCVPLARLLIELHYPVRFIDFVCQRGTAQMMELVLPSYGMEGISETYQNELIGIAINYHKFDVAEYLIQQGFRFSGFRLLVSLYSELNRASIPMFEFLLQHNMQSFYISILDDEFFSVKKVYSSLKASNIIFTSNMSRYRM